MLIISFPHHFTGIIRTAGVLNHETVPGYVLTVRAQDHGDVPLSNTAYIQINITDVNDNPPVFLQKHYMAKIREDAQIGSKVIQVGYTFDTVQFGYPYTVSQGKYKV